MLPGVVPDSFFDNLEEPQPLDSACGWADNLDLECSTSPEVLRSIIGPSSSRAHDIQFDLISPHE